MEVKVDELRNRLKPLVPKDSNLRYVLEIAAPFAVDFLGVIEQRAAVYINSSKTEEECLDFQEAKEIELSRWPEETRNADAMEIINESAIGHARFYIWASKETEETRETERVVTLSHFHASARTPDGSSFTGNIESTLKYSVGRILKRKQPRLKKLASYHHRLLLIVQDYDFAEP